jgi:NTE family protein
VFPFAPHRQLLALAGARPSLCKPDGLRRLIEAHITYDRLEDAAIPIHVTATDVASGMDVLLSTGDPTSAVLASAAIPAVFPTVTIGRRVLFDGGVANNAPISHAVALGATRVVVLPAGVACALPQPPRSAIATAVHALTLLIEQRLVLDFAAYHERVDLIVLPPLCPLSVSSTDFRSAGLLIEQARATSTRWLDDGNHRLSHPERFLSLHQHPHLVHADHPGTGDALETPARRRPRGAEGPIRELGCVDAEASAD